MFGRHATRDYTRLSGRSATALPSSRSAWATRAALIGAVLIAAGCSAAPAPGPDWPRWRGASFNGAANEPDLIPDGNFRLEVRWQSTLGSGYPGVVAAEGSAVTMFSDGTSDYVGALSIHDAKDFLLNRRVILRGDATAGVAAGSIPGKLGLTDTCFGEASALPAKRKGRIAVSPFLHPARRRTEDPAAIRALWPLPVSHPLISSCRAGPAAESSEQSSGCMASAAPAVILVSHVSLRR